MLKGLPVITAENSDLSIRSIHPHAFSAAATGMTGAAQIRHPPAG